MRGTGQVVYGSANWFTTLEGITEEYLVAREWDVVEGRGVNPADERGARKVALLGETVIEKLFAGENPIGRSIRIQRVPFTSYNFV